MLSEEEKKRLKNRDSLSPDVRAVNDYRVKKKLIKWLEDAEDALTIIRNPLSSRLKEDLSDVDVYRLLTISEIIMAIREFTPVAGEALKSDEWIVESDNTTRPANSVDIARSVIMQEHVDALKWFFGDKNPVSDAIAYAKLTDDPKWKDRFSEEERASAKSSGERVISSVDEYTLTHANKKEDPK